jgi:hypothetical protein
MGRTKLERDEVAPNPENAIVEVKTKVNAGKTTRRLGLISGTFPNGAQLCPQDIAMTHDELNKDQSTTTGREETHVRARSLAIAQTRHEWCRLRAMVELAHGDEGIVRLDAWVGDPSTAPTCSEN